jgi:hypothetical protein
MLASTKSLGFALVSMIVFMFAPGRPVGAQGVQHFSLPSSPHAHLATSFASQDATFSVTSHASAVYHSENSLGEYGFRVTENHPPENLATLFPFQESKTSFITEVRLPLAQLYGSRLHVGFFMLTMQNANLTLGPLATSQALHSLSQPHSVTLYGVGFSIPLGKQTHAEISKPLPWHTLQQFIHDR